jgi:hypothetical protein
MDLLTLILAAALAASAAGSSTTGTTDVPKSTSPDATIGIPLPPDTDDARSHIIEIG